ITVYSPVAKDLRFLLMMLRITSELERIGDHAVDNCEYVEMFRSNPPPTTLRELSEMSVMTLRMVHDALRAFEHEDIDKAQAVIGRDDQSDPMNAETFRHLLDRGPQARTSSRGHWSDSRRAIPGAHCRPCHEYL